METPQNRIGSSKSSYTSLVRCFEKVAKSQNGWCFNQLFWGIFLVFHSSSFIYKTGGSPDFWNINSRNMKELFVPILPPSIVSMLRIHLPICGWNQDFSSFGSKKHVEKMRMRSMGSRMFASTVASVWWSVSWKVYGFFNGFQWLFTSPWPFSLLVPDQGQVNFRQPKITLFAHKPWPLFQHGEFFLKLLLYPFSKTNHITTYQGRSLSLKEEFNQWYTRCLNWCQLLGQTKVPRERPNSSKRRVMTALRPFFDADDSQSQVPQVSFNCQRGKLSC